MAIGENIKRIRKEKGLTQKKLGELCGMKEANVRKYESGKADHPKIETIRKFADALEVDIIELTGIDGILSQSQQMLENFSKQMKEITSFRDYLFSIGYEVNESPIDSYDYMLSIKSSGESIGITQADLDSIERSVKEHIELNVIKLLRNKQ